jgi:hypothetical protein
MLMPSKTIQQILIFLFIILLLVLFLGVYFSAQTSTQSLGEAQRSYRAAIQAPTLIQRGQDLNHSLRILSSLEEHYQPFHSNGRFYYNLAENFYHLEQYPWAALYFYQTQSLMPRDESVKIKLNSTLEKLNLQSQEKDSIFRKVFFFHYQLSLPERLQILSLCTLVLFSLASIYLWKHYGFLKGLMAVVFLLWALFFCSVVYTKYFEPLEGIIVNATMLYRDSTEQSPLVSSKPIMEGSKVKVLDVSREGKWLKVSLPDGTLGFIPSESIRLIKI